MDSPAAAVHVKNKNGGFGHTEDPKLRPAETHKKIGNAPCRVLMGVFAASAARSYFLENTSKTIFSLPPATLTRPATDTGNPADHYKHHSGVAVLPALTLGGDVSFTATTSSHTAWNNWKTIWGIFAQVFFSHQKNVHGYFKAEKILKWNSDRRWEAGSVRVHFNKQTLWPLCSH